MIPDLRPGSSTSLYSSASSATNSDDLQSIGRVSSSPISIFSSYGTLDEDARRYSVGDVWKSLDKDPSELVRLFFEDGELKANFNRQDLLDTLTFADDDDHDHHQCSENQVEFLTVLTILNTVAELRELVRLPLSPELFSREKSLCFSFLKLFKYHFQLPLTDPNFGFRKYGFLLASESPTLLVSFLKVMIFASQSQDRTFWKLKKVFVLVVSFHFLNRNLMSALASTFSQAQNIGMLRTVGSIQDPSFPATFADHTGPLSAFQAIQRSIWFEENLSGKSAIGSPMIDVSVNSGCFSSMLSYISFLVQLHSQDTLSTSKIVSLLCPYFSDNERKEVMLIYVIHYPEFILLLQSFENKSDISARLKELLNGFSNNVTLELLTHFPGKLLLDLGFGTLVSRNCNPFVVKVMGTGITLTKSVFLPIFELLNHNFKLDLRHEKNLLFYLSLSLSTLANHVNDRQGLSEIYLLLGDLGCRFSFDTLLDYIQFILSATLNSLHCKNLKTSIFLPESLKNCFGFELFPPVRRENFSYESPIADRKGAMLGVFQETSVFQEQHFDSLLKQCILSNASLRMKTYRLLNHINQGTGIVTTCMQNTTEDGQIYKYTRDQGYELANFKNGSSINYRIAFSAIEISVKADISMLILSENLKVDDGRFSTTLSQFIVDTLLSLIIIYREFGLLSIFKTVLDICKEDLRLATGAAIVFSGILPQEKEGVSDSERKEQVATIIQQNTIVCNLIRLFVEQLDDGTTLAFKRMTNFMKNHPSSLRPKKRQKGTVTLDINEFLQVLK